MYVCMYACLHACMYACMYVCVYVCTQTHRIHLHMCVYIHTLTRTHKYTYVYIYIYACVIIYVYIYICTGRCTTSEAAGAMPPWNSPTFHSLRSPKVHNPLSPSLVPFLIWDIGETPMACRMLSQTRLWRPCKGQVTDFPLVCVVRKRCRVHAKVYVTAYHKNFLFFI